MAKTIKTVLGNCYKCGGTGYIPAYSGIANGVCFTCKGSGKVKVKVGDEPETKLDDYQQRCLKAIQTMDMSTWTYNQLLKARDFAHWYAYKIEGVLETWRERGEPHFQARQEERLQEFYANR